MSCFGFVCSLAWTLVNRASKYWQEVWEKKLKSAEKKVLGGEFSSKEENIQTNWFFGARRSSVSRSVIVLSYFTAVIWMLLAYKAFPGCTLLSMAALALSLICAIGMFCLGLWRGQADKMPGKCGCDP